MAFERLRRVPSSPELHANLMHLAQDFEQKHQYTKARMVYEHILRQNKATSRPANAAKRARHLAEVASSAESANAMEVPTGTQPALLGRYQVEKELGRGAMGVVYQGRDPKIGRVVAIKTLALGQEFDGAALVDARERFFREAGQPGGCSTRTSSPSTMRATSMVWPGSPWNCSRARIWRAPQNQGTSCR